MEREAKGREFLFSSDCVKQKVLKSDKAEVNFPTNGGRHVSHWRCTGERTLLSEEETMSIRRVYWEILFALNV